MKKQILIPLFVLLFLVIATTGVILYGNGYRFGFDNGRPDISGTGLLVATSVPDGAQVFINGHLTTATDNTINLAPKTYDVKIVKEGYFAWEKKITIKKELVSKADALLFPIAPKLESITNTGVQNPEIDPSQTRIAFTVASQSARKNGIFILDMTTRRILTLQGSSLQIADDTVNLFSKAKLSWSPDGTQLIASISATNSTAFYLLSTNGFNQNPADVTETLTSVNATWQKQKEDKEKAQMDTLRSGLKKLVSENFKILSWAPDETKILYSASQSANLPLVIKPRLIGSNSTEEDRNIKKDSVYVYDIKEDKNYKVLDVIPEHNPLSWFPDSKHLIHVNDSKIDIMEYDSQNSTTIYAGPFVDSYVFPWSDSSRIMMLTNLGNPNITPNLYTISLK